MARSFRFYEKKRGNRRTGLAWPAASARSSFSPPPLSWAASGCVRGFVCDVVPEWRVTHEFVEHQVHRARKEDRRETRADAATLYGAEVLIECQINGAAQRERLCDEYTSNPQECAAAIERYVVGKQYPCWYDPAIRAWSCSIAATTRGNGWSFLVPLSFVAFGSAGLLYAILHWGASVRRAAWGAADDGASRRWATTARRAIARRARLQRHHQQPRHAAGVSPAGEQFARLDGFRPAGGVRAVERRGVLVSCLGGSRIFGGRPDWPLTLFILPFAAVARRWRRSSCGNCWSPPASGRRWSRSPDHPLLPGGEYEVFVSQAGRGRLGGLDLDLVCEEEAIYQQGTNTRAETRRGSSAKACFAAKARRRRRRRSSRWPACAFPPERCTPWRRPQRRPLETGGPRRHRRLAQVSAVLHGGRLSALAAGEERRMSDPTVIIRLDGNGRAYQPGETLSGEYSVAADAADEIRRDRSVRALAHRGQGGRGPGGPRVLAARRRLRRLVHPAGRNVSARPCPAAR